MDFRKVLVVVLAVVVLFAASCSRTPAPPPATPTTNATGTTPATPKETPKLSADMEEAFKALEKFKPEDDFRFEKEFEALKTKAQELAKKKDKEFLATLFILAESGPPIKKKAANELLCYIISDYKGSEWPDQDMYRQKALAVVLSSPDKEYRKGCWGFLTYYYEPEKITPVILSAFPGIKDNELRQDILENLSYMGASSFINKNEEALNKLCVPIAKDEKETPEIRIAAMKVLAYSGQKDPAVKTELEGLKKAADERVKEAAGKALDKLSGK